MVGPGSMVPHHDRTNVRSPQVAGTGARHETAGTSPPVSLVARSTGGRRSVSSQVISTKPAEPHSAAAMPPHRYSTPDSKRAHQPAGGVGRVVEADIECDRVVVAVGEDEVRVQRRVHCEHHAEHDQPADDDDGDGMSRATATAMPGRYAREQQRPPLRGVDLVERGIAAAQEPRGHRLHAAIADRPQGEECADAYVRPASCSCRNTGSATTNQMSRDPNRKNRRGRQPIDRRRLREDRTQGSLALRLADVFVEQHQQHDDGDGERVLPSRTARRRIRSTTAARRRGRSPRPSGRSSIR